MMRRTPPQPPAATPADAQSQDAQSQDDSLALVGDPIACAPGAEARFGAKGAALSRLAAAGLRVPAGVLIDAALCASVRDRLEAGLEPDPETAAALRARIGALLAEAAGPETSEAAYVMRLSPQDPVPNLTNEGAVAAEAAPAAAIAALRLWSSPRARRRRAAANAGPACALLIQRAAPSGPRAKALRLYDPETGEAAPQARMEGTPPAPAQKNGEEGGGESDAPPRPPEAALAAAAEVEAILGEPLELDLALDPEGGAPMILSVRPLRLSARARLRVALRLAESGRISRDAALLMIEPSSLEELLHPSIEPGYARDALAQGVPASPGAAAGRLCLTAAEAQALARRGEPAILARVETSPEDVHGMDAAAGVLTMRGGLTSHAAVVARGLGLPCVVGAANIRLDIEAGALIAPGDRVVRRGDWITLDGSSGEVMLGQAPTRRPAPSGDFATLMSWADARRRMRVRANADTPADAATAVRLGVDGVGLCRTEHMFFDPERIMRMRQMILADDEAERRAALERLLPMQRADFVSLFEILNGARAGDAAAPPVTIRLLDPPLHEFLPKDPAELTALAEALGKPPAEILKRARALEEFNPMLGKRGCRLGVAFPEIYEMQARAIFEASLQAEARTGRRQQPEIMIPLVSAVSELQLLEDRIADVAEAVEQERGARLDYGVGIMVETPRAALMAGLLGPLSTFFSFGTNDLTQMTYGLSRDDAGALMRDYVAREVFEADPFQTLDRDGVGELIRMGVERGRAANPRLEIGLCGEHGGSPSTIAFCEETGFDYVSCSPFRAPIARLAAAQATIRAERAAAGRPDASTAMGGLDAPSAGSAA